MPTLVDYLNLMSNSRASAYTIWGFLLTAAVGVSAYLAATPTHTAPISLGILFALFAASNFLALKANHTTRKQLVRAAHKLNEKDQQETHELHKGIIENLSVRHKYELGLQPIVSLAVLSVIYLRW